MIMAKGKGMSSTVYGYRCGCKRVNSMYHVSRKMENCSYYQIGYFGTARVLRTGIDWASITL